jgi:flagellar motor switch protein FliM
MKSPGILIAERPLAQHSERLAASTADPKEIALSLEEALPALRDAIVAALSELTGHARPEVAFDKVERMAASKAHRLLEPVGVHMLLGMRGAGEILLALGRASALMLTDRMFGGSGATPAKLPDSLPAAARLTMERMGETLGRAIATGLACPAPLALAQRNDVLGKLLPARDPDMFFLLRCTIAIGEGDAWPLHLIVRESEVEKLLAGAGGTTAARPRGDRRRPDGVPFGDMAMTLTAVLAETRIPVGRLSALRPGDILPLPLRAKVPLRLGAVEIAHAQAGSEDGHMALRLTRIVWNERNTENER